MGEEGIVLTTNGTYLWSFVTPIFRNQQICDLVHDNSIMAIVMQMVYPDSSENNT